MLSNVQRSLEGFMVSLCLKAAIFRLQVHTSTQNHCIPIIIQQGMQFFRLNSDCSWWGFSFQGLINQLHTRKRYSEWHCERVIVNWISEQTKILTSVFLQNMWKVIPCFWFEIVVINSESSFWLYHSVSKSIAYN